MNDCDKGTPVTRDDPATPTFDEMTGAFRDMPPDPDHDALVATAEDLPSDDVEFASPPPEDITDEDSVPDDEAAGRRRGVRRCTGSRGADDAGRADMSAGDTTPGRRREDVPFGDLPDYMVPGDYWKYLDRDTGQPLNVTEDGNLTGTVWGFYAPVRGGIGTLRKHTVRENPDGTATIVRADGSSNSVLIARGYAGDWYGYLEQGVWREI